MLESTEKAIAARQRAAHVQELADSEERYRTLFASAPMALFVCDRNAVIQQHNARAVELWGREPACGVEKHCGSTRLWLPDGTLLPHDQSPMVEMLRTGVPVNNVEVSIERPDGSRLPVLVNFAPLKNALGDITGAITSFIDISNRNRAEQLLRESEERFRAVADNIPQLAWMAEPGTKGQATWFNKAWLEYTGTTMEQNHGSGWQAVHHPDHAERVVAKFEHHVRENLGWEDTFPLRCKDGSYRWFLSRMNVIRDESGEAVRIFGTNTDITEQRAAEEALKESDRRKTEFLAMLAHELRNPLAPIRNAVQLVRLTASRDRQQPEVESVHTAVEIMERQISQMVRLVDDLLDVSRISRGKIELRRERVELASVVHQAVETCRPAIEAAHQKLTVTLPPEPVYLDGDPVRLAQVFCNLLNNSGKFSQPEASISLAAQRQGTEVVMTVKDAGVGIARDMLPTIFDMFTQVDQSLDRPQGGLGIGLTLVKSLVEMHDGAIEAHSDGLGRGSEFVVRLPILAAAPQSAAAAPKLSEPTTASARRILVVDDNRDSAKSLAALLKLSGNEAHTAHDGQEAVEAAAALRPEVVLLDIGLPKLNGYEAARHIREQSWGKEMVLIALTGWGQEEDRQRSKEAGFDDHLVKPVKHADLLSLLASL